jgi:hypothetical protein
MIFDKAGSKTPETELNNAIKTNERGRRSFVIIIHKNINVIIIPAPDRF